jgi:hypothetical protein
MLWVQSAVRGRGRLRLPLRIACGMIAATEIKAANECGTFARELQ